MCQDGCCHLKGSRPWASLLPKPQRRASIRDEWTPSGICCAKMLVVTTHLKGRRHHHRRNHILLNKLRGKKNNNLKNRSTTPSHCNARPFKAIFAWRIWSVRYSEGDLNDSSRRH